MTMLDLPNIVIDWVISSGFSKWQVIIVLMLGFFVMGMFLEVISIMMITLPIVYPLIIALGFDGIWFAVLMILNMEIALITPPVGLNLFVIQSIEKTNISTVLRGVAPFFIIMMLGLLIVALFPALSTWLPNLMVQ
jgi:C4-dicarboxylate transporter DctM subunit